MSANHLAVYLNDHLAGAAAALQTLDMLATHPDAAELNRIATELRTAIAEDREALEAIMRRVGVPSSGVRQAVGWIGEKAAELKVRVDDRSDGLLRIFELLEFVALGIDGKRALWAVLRAAAVPELEGVDYETLSRRADAQRATIEALRLQWGTAALGTNAGTPTTKSCGHSTIQH
jgi:hypothetical protein